MEDNMFSDVEQLIVVVTMVSAAVLFFLPAPPQFSGYWDSEIFYFGAENCRLSYGV